jgi:hypothetical protein
MHDCPYDVQATLDAVLQFAYVAPIPEGILGPRFCRAGSRCPAPRSARPSRRHHKRGANSRSDTSVAEVPTTRADAIRCKVLGLGRIYVVWPSLADGLVMLRGMQGLSFFHLDDPKPGGDGG